MVVINLNLFKKYDVALSFAEENRISVDLVAQLLKKQGIKVFYDNDLRIPSWGRYLRNYLDKAYRLQAKLCVVFVSKDYERKRWTNFELGRIQARSFFQKNESYVLPYLLDDSSFTEQFLEVGCLTYRTHDEYKLADAIKEKLDRQPERRLAIWFKDLYKIKLRLAAMITLLVIASVLGLKDKLTPVDILTNRIYERSRKNINAICKDGWLSPSEGQGTCSRHHGVARPVDSFIYDKTLEQCNEEAKKISWFSP